MISTGLFIYHRQAVLRSFAVEDYMLFAAFLATMILVIQITWAITNEEQDKHLKEIFSMKLTLILHVN